MDVAGSVFKVHHDITQTQTCESGSHLLPHDENGKDLKMLNPL